MGDTSVVVRVGRSWRGGELGCRGSGISVSSINVVCCGINMKTLRNWVWDEIRRAVGIYTRDEMVVRVWEGRVVVLGGMVVWCMRVFWVEVGVLWGYLEAGMRFDGRGTYLKGWLRRCWVEAVELVGGWGLEWGLG